jgi:hypothetical protein
MGQKGKQEVHLCFACAYARSPRVIVRDIFSALVFCLGPVARGQVWKFPVVGSWQHSTSLGFQSIPHFVVFWIYDATLSNKSFILGCLRRMALFSLSFCGSGSGCGSFLEDLSRVFNQDVSWGEVLFEGSTG